MKYDDIKKIEQSISNFINKYLIKNILIAVSGGQDSIYLFKLFEKLILKKKLKFHIYI